MVISARKLLNVEPLVIKENMRGNNFKVRFEDGVELPMSAGDIVTSRYYWEFVRLYGLKLTSDLSITTKYEDGFFNSGVHSDILSHMYKKYINDVLIPNNQLSFDNMESSWKTMFEILNRLFSELQYDVLEHGVSLSILDYVELQQDETLNKLIEESVKNPTNPLYVEKVNQEIKNVMLKHPKNNLSKLYNCKAVNRVQVSHSIGIRGFTTDINNMIYSEVVGLNLTKGLMDPYSMACESSVMGKALKLQEFGIRHSEWLQRELHLPAMSIGSVILTDCGNRHYQERIVKDAQDLSLLAGAYILLDGKEVELDASKHKELIGNTIYMRRINDCKLLKAGHVCWKCLGAATYTMARHTSVSHTLITMAMAVIGQAMLSAKHFTESQVLKTIKLPPITAKYLKVEDDGFYVREDANIKYIVLNHNSYYGYRLLSHNMVNKIDTLDTSKLSIVDGMYVATDISGSVLREYMEVKIDGRFGILDAEFIKHSLTNTTLTESGDYKVDMTGYKGRLLFLENKEFAYDQFNKEFKSLLQSYTNKGTTVEKAINDIYNYLNSKLTVNIKIVELLVAAITVENMDMDDYSIGLDKDTRKVINYSKVINNRGLGISLGFERQKELLRNPSIYLNKVAKPYNPLESVWYTKTMKFTDKLPFEVDKNIPGILK